MALNEQLKAMLGEDAATTAEQFAASAVKPRGVADENDPRANQDMEYAMDAPTHGRRARRARAGPRRSAAAAAAPAAKAPARGPARRKPASYTFGNEKLKEIGRDNRILLEKMARITLEGSGPNAAVAPRVPRKKVVASESINRRRRNDKIANENAVRAACPPGTHALLVTRGAAPQQAIARRLASVKASSALSRPSMNQHKKKHKKLLRNMRVRSAPPLAASPGHSHPPALGCAGSVRVTRPAPRGQCHAAVWPPQRRVGPPQR